MNYDHSPSLFLLPGCGVGSKAVLRLEMQKILCDLLVECVRFLFLSKLVDQNIWDAF